MRNLLAGTMELRVFSLLHKSVVFTNWVKDDSLAAPLCVGLECVYRDLGLF